MRTYGKNADGVWKEVTETSYVWLATLAQTLRLNEKESPFYSNYGIPAHDSVMTQVAPDLAVNRTQSQYAPYFANLSVVRNLNATQPTYNVSAVFQNGTTFQSEVVT
jgi:hypothetical protein